MTMQHHDHPHDERLAALAGGDPEAAGDAALDAHVSDCDRCRSVVDDLGTLRAALADLPDVVPSRPLRLVPPVPEARATEGWRGWVRRLAAPAMAAGAGLALIGAVGLGGMASGLSAGGAAPEVVTSEENALGDRGLQSPITDGGEFGAPEASGEPRPVSGGERFPLTDISTPAPWLALVLGGIALVVIGLVLRFAIRPRAG